MSHTEFHRARTGDTVAVPPELVDQYTEDPDWERVAASQAGGLKGAALDEALDQAGLPKSGSADEKRARLAEHQNTQES